MKITIEKHFPRCDEVALYYHIQGLGPLDKVSKELNAWFSNLGYHAGFGGHHVWMHDKNNERVLLMVE